MDRLVSDHETVTSHRASLERIGRTDRPQLPLPAALTVAPEELISLSLAGRKTHAHINRTLDGRPALRGVFETRRLARSTTTPESDPEENLLLEWLETVGYAPGDTLVVDVLIEGYAYGLRTPGERVVYAPPEPPDPGLADVADDLG